MISISGFKIKFRPSFFVLAAFSVFTGSYKYLAALFVLTALHEACHIFTAGLWGISTRSVTVTPIGMYADMDGLESLHIIKRIAVAAAGPLFNLSLCLFCDKTARGMNLALALFNLLPVYPLDGGKIFHYIISYFAGVLRGNTAAVRTGTVLSTAIAAAGVVQLVLYPPNISLLCLGIYFYRLGRANAVRLTYNFYKSVMNKRRSAILPLRCFSVSEDTDIKTVIYRLGWDHSTLVYIRGREGMPITEERLMEHITQNGLRGKIKDVDIAGI